MLRHKICSRLHEVCTRTHPRRSLEAIQTLLGPLEASGESLGAFWGLLEASGRPLGGFGVLLEASWRSFGDLLEPSCGVLEASWDVLGHFWTLLGIPKLFLKLLTSHFDRSRGRPELQNVFKRLPKSISKPPKCSSGGHQKSDTSRDTIFHKFKHILDRFQCYFE